MRLFEATGVGAFLLTDFKDNLHTLFAPDREVAVWRSVEDCLKAIDHALGNDAARQTIARAGQDQFAGLNDALDRFVAKALARNLPITVVNHATGPHAFDTADDSETTRGIIRSILGFFRLHLLV